MGFGFLLIGYVIAFVFSASSVYFFADIIGGAVMFFGLYKLSAYGKNFERAAWIDVLYLVVCGVRAVFMLLRLFESGSIVMTIVSIVVLLVTLIYHFFMLAAVYYISIAADMQKEVIAARMNLILMFIYYPVYILAMLFSSYMSPTIQTLISVVLLVYNIVLIARIVLLLHSCYCLICPKGQEHGEPAQNTKKSLLGKLTEKSDDAIERAYRYTLKPRKKTEEKQEEIPGYLRVKRKKNKRHK